ncbi:MAG: hypothetical protein ACHQ4H_14815 [Ktedonobacterales bacterium]
MSGHSWLVISEAIKDGGSVELHRLPAPASATVGSGSERTPEQAAAATWAQAYSDRSGKPTIIELVVEDDAGVVTDVQGGWFYYDPTFPDHNPYQDYYGY